MSLAVKTTRTVETEFHLSQGGLSYKGSYRLGKGDPGVWMTNLVTGDDSFDIEVGEIHTFSLDGAFGTSDFRFQIDVNGNLSHGYPSDHPVVSAIDFVKSKPSSGKAHIYFNLKEVEIDPGDYRGEYKTSLVGRNSDDTLDWVSALDGVKKFTAIVGLTFFVSNDSSAGLSFFNSRIDSKGEVAPVDDFSYCASQHPDSAHKDRLVIETTVVMADRGSDDILVSGYPKKISSEESVTVIRGLGIRVSS